MNEEKKEMTFRFFGKRELKILVALTLTFMIVLSSFSILVPKVRADAYNQIPLWINIMEGATADREQIDKIEKEIDAIFAKAGLNWRVTSVIVDENYPDPDKSNDNPGEVREGDEENGLYRKGKKEVKDLSGFKIFVVKKILLGNGSDSGYIGGGEIVPGTRTAVLVSNTSDGSAVGGDIWAHEIGHMLGLGHRKQNGTERPENDLMYRYDRGGKDLQAEDITTMNITKRRRAVGLPSLTQEQISGNASFNEFHRETNDTYGDSTSGVNYTDIQDVYFGFWMLNETSELYITTYLGGVIPIDFPWLNYYVALNTDNDPATGGEFEGWLGIDFLIEVDWNPPGIVDGMLYSYPSYTLITPLEAHVQTNFKHRSTEGPPTLDPPEPISNSIVVDLPLAFLGPLADPVPFGAFLWEPFGWDRLELTDLYTSPPIRPTLTFDPPAAPPDTVVTATGEGYTPTNSVSIIFDHVNLSTTTVHHDGTFETSFVVPDIPADHYMVDAIDESHNVGVNVFTVTTSPPVDTPVVGGIHILKDRLRLLAPYIGLTILLAVGAATVVYAKKRKKQQTTVE